MKNIRLLLILILSVVSMTSVRSFAQNNSLKIDDSCYPSFRQADSLVGTDRFPALIQEFENKALSVEDKKAQVLVYVLKLRDAKATGPDEKVDKYYEELKEVAKRLDYLQYYFYAYHLKAVYYYNCGFQAKAYRISEEMLDEAVAMDNEYGCWFSARNIADLYMDSYKLSRAKEYLLKAVEIYENTDNRTIKVQAMSKTYMDLARCDELGTPDFEKYLDKALATARVSTDTLTVYFYRACNSVLKKNFAEYNKYKEICLNNTQLKRVRAQASVDFMMADAAVSGDWDYFLEALKGLNHHEDLSFVTQLAAKYGNLDVVTECYQRHIMLIYNSRDHEVQRTIEQLELKVENDKLNQTIIQQKGRTNRILMVTSLILLLAALFISVASIYYIRKLRRMRKEAESANKMKTRFIQNMNHEIRTPLNAIVGFTQLLIADDELTEEEKQRYGRYISNNSSLLMMLIDDILDISDVDNGQYRLAIGNCNVEEICNNAMNTVETRVPAGVEYRYEKGTPEGFVIETDGRRVQQVLINFLTNSCKHTCSGEIVLACSLEENPGSITFSVRDTGGGVPLESAEEIFNRFAKLDGFKQGSGLGLNICRVIAGKLGGRVDIDRNYGRCADPQAKGARFVFILPLTAPTD